MDRRREFIQLACDKGALKFGSFVTKAGRQSPYFFNAGLFDDGLSFARLCELYAAEILAQNVAFDMLFGPAYKGIPLVSGVAIALARAGRNVPFAFNRKEAKDHGEGGVLIGAPVAGRVLILDDVISAGTSVKESVTLIHTAQATPAGVMIALDRQEKGADMGVSAVEQIKDSYQMTVISLACLEDLVMYLADSPELQSHLNAVQLYRNQYGVQHG